MSPGRPADRVAVVADGGASACVKPRRAASSSRRSSCGTARISPPRPTSPTATVPPTTGCLRRALPTASTSARSTPRLGDAEPAGDARVHLGLRRADASVLVEHRQHHREARRIDARRRPSRRQAVGHDQRLNLHEQRARALEHHRHRGTGHAGTPVEEEARRRVGHVVEAVVGHLEQPELVTCSRTGASARGACAARARDRRRTRGRCRRRARARAARRACLPW